MVMSIQRLRDLRDGREPGRLLGNSASDRGCAKSRRAIRPSLPPNGVSGGDQVPFGDRQELEFLDLVKGYVLRKNQYVLLNDEHFDSVKVESSSVVEH